MAKGDNLIPHRWEPGTSPYAEYLAKLTPEEKALHLRQRAERKAIKQAMKTVVSEYQERWVSNLHNAAWQQLMKARDSGDTQAFIAVWDRIIGKPETEISVDDNRVLPWTDQDNATE